VNYADPKDSSNRCKELHPGGTAGDCVAKYSFGFWGKGAAKSQRICAISG